MMITSKNGDILTSGVPVPEIDQPTESEQGFGEFLSERYGVEAFYGLFFRELDAAMEEDNTKDGTDDKESDIELYGVPGNPEIDMSEDENRKEYGFSEEIAEDLEAYESE